jgi:hypothetical protein
MFFPRTQRTLLRTSKGSHFQAHKWVFLTFKICFLYPNKSQTYTNIFEFKTLTKKNIKALKLSLRYHIQKLST